MIWPSIPRRTLAHRAEPVQAVDTHTHVEEVVQEPEKVVVCSWEDGGAELLCMGMGMLAWIYFWYTFTHR